MKKLKDYSEFIILLFDLLFIIIFLYERFKLFNFRNNMIQISLLSLVMLVLIIIFTSLYVFLVYKSRAKQKAETFLLQVQFLALKDILKIRFKNHYLMSISGDIEAKKELVNGFFESERKESEKYLSKKYDKIERDTIKKILDIIYS